MTPTPKKRGRPSVEPGERSVGVCVKLSAPAYAKACAQARVARVSVPELLRRHLDPVTRRKDFSDI
jgi:hypothetical protein